MKILICNRCKGIDCESIIARLKELDSRFTFIVGCNAMCGVGRSKQVVILDNKPIIADTEDALLLKIKERLEAIK